MTGRRRTLLSSSGGIDPTTGRGKIGDYEVVDLGLPSGLLWATCNVGATKESDYGDYYMYGKGSQTYIVNDNIYKGSKNPLPSNYDTATQVMGEGWRMPTKNELQNLKDNIYYEWVTNFNGSGVTGVKFTSKTNPNAYMFIPAAGGYRYGDNSSTGSRGFIWSSTPSNSAQSYCFNFYGSRIDIFNSDRDYGFSVRGVHAAV